MKSKEKYYGTYKDKHGSSQAIIYNDYDELSVEIEGVIFTGSTFDCLEITNKNEYTTKQIVRFSLHPMGIYQSNDYVYLLNDFELTVVIPQYIIYISTNKEIQCDVKIIIRYKYRTNNDEFDESIVLLSVEINNEVYESIGGDFESAFLNLQKKIDHKYKLKNCFGCLYSDYSVYGHQFFGSMLCYVRQKGNYLMVKTKSDYMDLSDDIDHVQEIYCCKDFEVRQKESGYRG